MALKFNKIHLFWYALDFRIEIDINEPEIHARVQFTTFPQTHSKNSFVFVLLISIAFATGTAVLNSIRLPARNLICDTQLSNNCVSCRLSSHILVALDTPSPSSWTSPLFVRQSIPILQQIYCSGYWFFALEWILGFLKKYFHRMKYLILVSATQWVDARDYMIGGHKTMGSCSA